MLSEDTRLRLKDILNRLANDMPVSLSERVYLHNYADQDQTIAKWLHQARSKQQKNKHKDGIDNLLNELCLGPIEPEVNFDPKEDDLGEWFGGAPSWLSRS